ncbi:MAG: hypothetical protein AAF234_14590 [Pseudomonadota bacterium]
MSDAPRTVLSIGNVEGSADGRSGNASTRWQMAGCLAAIAKRE